MHRVPKSTEGGHPDELLGLMLLLTKVVLCYRSKPVPHTQLLPQAQFAPVLWEQQCCDQ